MKFAKNKKKTKIKIKFQKMKGTFMESIIWLKSHHPPQVCTYNVYVYKITSRNFMRNPNKNQSRNVKNLSFI